MTVMKCETASILSRQEGRCTLPRGESHRTIRGDVHTEIIERGMSSKDRNTTHDCQERWSTTLSEAKEDSVEMATRASRPCFSVQVLRGQRGLGQCKGHLRESNTCAIQDGRRPFSGDLTVPFFLIRAQCRTIVHFSFPLQQFIFWRMIGVKWRRVPENHSQSISSPDAFPFQKGTRAQCRAMDDLPHVPKLCPLTKELFRHRTERWRPTLRNRCHRTHFLHRQKSN